MYDMCIPRSRYLYPWLHPSYHQSQVHDPTNLTLFPSYQEVQNVTVTLRAGDALYIPPYWMHRIETLDEEDGEVGL